MLNGLFGTWRVTALNRPKEVANKKNIQNDRTEEIMSRFVDGRPMKSSVAITTASTYDEAERAVVEAIELLGGPSAICKSGDVVMIKPNMILPKDPALAETTHPSVIGALIKVLKKTGATIKVGEQAAWHFDTEEAFDVTGIRKAALEAGADEIINWEEDNRVAVKIPDPRSIQTAYLPASVMEADVFIHVPKMKTNYMYNNATLAIKGLLGLLANKDRGIFHRTIAEMGWATCDLAKAVAPKHRLTLIDGITGMEGGGPHAGLRVDPGVILASSDMVAVEAVGCAIMGFHPLESPGVQVAMKADLGTGELSEIEILGKPIHEVLYPFKRPLRRYVSKWKNVKEYIGGTCEGCLLAITRTPFTVDPRKTYALIAGTRVLMPDNIAADEVWLIGECACRENHQFPGFSQKIGRVGTIHRFPACPGIIGFHDQYKRPITQGTPYEIPDMITIDGSTLAILPDLVRKGDLEAAEARREGRMTLEEAKIQQRIKAS
jgi:uncharacterized protein (DUF362 family)